MKGYKIFDSNLQCRGFQFEIGKEYKHDGPFQICNNGFHFCLKASHCFSYYDFNPSNIVCEVEALGETQTHDEDSKVATNHIRIIRQLTWEEVLRVANEGSNNTGHSNTGYSNTGYSNTGDWNTGDRNTGYSNTGYSNTGNRNTGNRNTGDRNTGNRNTGNRNTGDWNTGYSNTGDWNTGDWNTGYSNTGNRNTGAFCTGEKYIKLFNKGSDWTEDDFKSSKAYSLLCSIDTKMWVHSDQMSEEEKEAHPSHSTAGGYLKDIPYKESFQNKWHNWSEESRNAFKSLPNFDAAIFEEITGVKIE